MPFGKKRHRIQAKRKKRGRYVTKAQRAAALAAELAVELPAKNNDNADSVVVTRIIPEKKRAKTAVNYCDSPDKADTIISSKGRRLLLAATFENKFHCNPNKKRGREGMV